MKEFAYCPHCRDYVEFNTKCADDTVEMDGRAYTFSAKHAICKTRGADAAFDPYREEAGVAFNDAVREAHDIVALTVARDLPKRYNIGKRPLSKLLGWGDLVCSRFIEGTAPKKAYSDRIRELYESPEAFGRLLKANCEAPTDVAFRKSMRAVDDLIGSEYPDASRLLALGDMIVGWADGDITNMAAQKLVYYVQGFSTVLLDGPIISVEPRAWALGPVYGQLWHEYKAELPNAQSATL